MFVRIWLSFARSATPLAEIHNSYRSNSTYLLQHTHDHHVNACLLLFDDYIEFSVYRTSIANHAEQHNGASDYKRISSPEQCLPNDVTASHDVDHANRSKKGGVGESHPITRSE